MSLQKIRLKTLFLISGSFFIVDRVLKQLASSDTSFRLYLFKPWIGWEYFQNTGIAFGIPLPWYSALFYTPLIFILLFFYFIRQKEKNNILMLGLCFIVFGALSNLLDRLSYHFTVDYIRLFTAIINLADVMIVIGALCLVLHEFQKEKNFRKI